MQVLFFRLYQVVQLLMTGKIDEEELVVVGLRDWSFQVAEMICFWSLASLVAGLLLPPDSPCCSPCCSPEPSPSGTPNESRPTDRRSRP